MPWMKDKLKAEDGQKGCRFNASAPTRLLSVFSNRTKLAIYFLIICAAVCAGYFTYASLRKSDISRFESEYYILVKTNSKLASLIVYLLISPLHCVPCHRSARYTTT
jgi:hypothetical protein